MSSLLEKSLAVIALLARHPEGLSVSTLAGRLGQPASGVHRLLRELARLGYVRQVQAQGDYRLTIKLPAMGLGFLGRAGITDVAQPVLDRLAADSGELVRLSVADGDTLVWVAVAQGARAGCAMIPGRSRAWWRGWRVPPPDWPGSPAWTTTAPWRWPPPSNGTKPGKRRVPGRRPFP